MTSAATIMIAPRSMLIQSLATCTRHSVPLVSYQNSTCMLAAASHVLYILYVVLLIDITQGTQKRKERFFSEAAEAFTLGSWLGDLSVYTRYGSRDRHDNLCSWPELTQYCVHGTPPCLQVTSSPISHWNAQLIQENPNTTKLSLHNSIIQGKPPASVRDNPSDRYRHAI
jgi:hypothetical protein